MDFVLKRIVNFLDWLTREIPPPKPQPPAIKLIPSQLTPAEQAILDQAEASLRQVEIQSIPVLQAIQENRVIHSDPAPVQFLAVPEVLEVSSVPVAVEVLEVPEISEIPEILATVEPLQAEAQFPAGWAAIEAREEAQVEQPIAVTETPEVPELPELPQPTVNISSRKASSRGQLVEQHLEQAWADGFRTYDQLMNYVELATGKGCSKRVISAWKKARKLDEAVAA